jgi:hypothetical protein
VGVVFAALVLIGVVVERAVAQAKPGTAKPAPKTTLSGIYTAAQAAKGEDLYYTLCVSCHPKGTYAGPSFKTNWNNRPLWDLWDWISNKMPKNDPVWSRTGRAGDGLYSSAKQDAGGERGASAEREDALRDQDSDQVGGRVFRPGTRRPLMGSRQSTRVAWLSGALALVAILVFPSLGRTATR